MAINGIVHGGMESKWGISEESTFGTAIADGGAFEMIEGPIGAVDPGLIRNTDVKHGDGRFLSASNDYVSDKGGLRVISFSDMVVRGKDLGWLLYAVCQNVSEAVGTPFEKTYTIANATTQPNFASNAGYFCTIGIYDTIGGYHRKYPSCILRTLTLTADLAGDGLLRASGEWISGFTESTTATFSGSWAYNTQTYYNFYATPTKTLSGGDVVLYGFDLTITNGAVRTGSTGANGICETYSLGQYEITGNMNVKYDANVVGMFASERAGTSTAIQLACGPDGAIGNFDFTCSTCLLDTVTDDYTEARGRAINVPFKAATSAVITCSDANDRTW
jgi:hypothetical protein